MLPVSLAPRPGFCIKTTTVCPGLLLEPIPANRKVFVNIAWDPNVPPPPEGSDEAIQSAMQGHNPKGWYVPLIVSDVRNDKDKSGKPSIVVDCIFNTSVKARTLRDPEFKIFLIELSLQRIEAQTRLSLSRSIGTPNIASKGKLLPRTVQIPAALFSSSTPPLIQEISSKPATSILKSSADGPLSWTWSQSGTHRLKIEIYASGLTPAVIASSTLYVSARTLELTLPHRPPLSIDLSLSDAEMASHVAAYHSSEKKKEHDTALKRQRDFDVDGAEAEWKLGTGVVVVFV